MRHHQAQLSIAAADRGGHRNHGRTRSAREDPIHIILAHVRNTRADAVRALV